MPGATTAKSMPYPLPTDPIANGADQARKLAQSVDNATQTVTASVVGTTANVTASATVTWPVPYASPPIAVATAAGGGALADVLAAVTITAITTTGATVYCRRSNAGTTTINVVAVGKVTAVA